MPPGSLDPPAGVLLYLLTPILYILLRLEANEDALYEGRDLTQQVDIATRLFELREERGWSQTRTAKEAGVSQTSIVHIETGRVRPRLATLRRLAKGFGITVEELTGAPLAATPANSR